jgi:glycosyltransferase involved in cell wall biosynthesis
MSAPRVTVLCVVHDGERFLRESIDSILAQSFGDFELLLVDDGSTDRTPEIFEQAARDDRRVRTLRKERSGLTRSLNEVLDLARGEYVARQDDDDLSSRRRLEAQVNVLDARPRCAAVGCQYDWIDERGARFDRTTVPRASTAIKLALMLRNALPHSGVTFRRDAVKALGGYDVSLPVAQDYDLWCRLALRHELANLPTVALARRDHARRVGLARRGEQVAARDLVRARYRAAILSGQGPRGPEGLLLRAWARALDLALPR